MSENLDLVRSIYAAWERGDYYSSVEWAHPEIEFVVMDGPSPGGLTGVTAVEDNWREFQQAWEDYRINADEYRQLDGDRVLALIRLRGRGGTSGLEMEKAAASRRERGRTGAPGHSTDTPALLPPCLRFLQGTPS